MTTAFPESSDIKMKKQRISLILSALLTIVFLLVSCSDSGPLTLTYDKGNLTDPKNGITYIITPMCFEPIATELEPYAVCTDPELELFGIVGCDTSVWLSEKFEGIGYVYYAGEEDDLPSIREFDADNIVICIEQIITTGIGTVSDKGDIENIVDAFINGERTTIIPEGDFYKLKFASDKYPGIYYNLLYIEAENGENYIYDRSTKTCSAVGDVMYEYLPR